MTVRGRFAPSPSGELHLGNARTALLAWLQVRSAGGRFVMRVEDLDPGRSRPEYLETQLADLRWLGLDWDEGPDVGGGHGPYLQSLRHDLYAAALERLDDRGLLFECFCSRKEIAAAAEAPHGAEDEGPVYPGTCQALGTGERAARGTRPNSALRLEVPAGPICFDDLVAGRQCFRPEAETGPFVVRRKDGVAAYQLAVVVDDAAMGITDVLRGADLLSSTARQLVVYGGLDLPPPSWAHVPLMLGEDGDRLSKRHGAVALRELREGGVDPRAVVGWLASTCGMGEPEESASPADLVDRFSLEDLPRGPAVVADLPWAPPA